MQFANEDRLWGSRKDLVRMGWKKKKPEGSKDLHLITAALPGPILFFSSFRPEVIEPMGQLSKARIALFSLVEWNGSIQRVPVDNLHPIVKPGPFREWAVDLIGKPPSNKQHTFILVAMDSFNEWAEATYRRTSERAPYLLPLLEVSYPLFPGPESK